LQTSSTNTAAEQERADPITQVLTCISSCSIRASHSRASGRSPSRLLMRRTRPEVGAGVAVGVGAKEPARACALGRSLAGAPVDGSTSCRGARAVQLRREPEPSGRTTCRGAGVGEARQLPGRRMPGSAGRAAGTEGNGRRRRGDGYGRWRDKVERDKEPGEIK
jgi:hypothetical protein